MDMKRVLGIDIGGYNLAICIIEYPSKEIIEWKSISIFEKEHKCEYKNRNGTECKSKAKYKNKSEYACGRHKMPNAKTYKEKTFKQYTINMLIEKCIERLLEMSWYDVDTIIIEKQPPCNPKMKMLSYAIHTYCVLKAIERNIKPPKIIYSHAKNKLTIVPKDIQSNKKGEYQKRKDIAVKYTESRLQEERYNKWKIYFESQTKKDDLADSFLYCLWFIEKMNR